MNLSTIDAEAVRGRYGPIPSVNEASRWEEQMSKKSTSRNAKEEGLDKARAMTKRFNREWQCDRQQN